MIFGLIDYSCKRHVIGKGFKSQNLNSTRHRSKGREFVNFKSCFFFQSVNCPNITQKDCSCRKPRRSFLIKQPISGSAVITFHAKPTLQPGDLATEQVSKKKRTFTVSQLQAAARNNTLRLVKSTTHSLLAGKRATPWNFIGASRENLRRLCLLNPANRTSPIILVWAKLTQRDEAKQKSEQEQEEEEETQQPLPPGAARVGAAAESSSAKRAAVPVDLWGQCKAVSLPLKHYWMHPGNESLRCEYHSKSNNKDKIKYPQRWLCLSSQLQMIRLLKEEVRISVIVFKWFKIKSWKKKINYSKSCRSLPSVASFHCSLKSASLFLMNLPTASL